MTWVSWDSVLVLTDQDMELFGSLRYPVFSESMKKQFSATRLLLFPFNTPGCECLVHDKAEPGVLRPSGLQYNASTDRR